MQNRISNRLGWLLTAFALALVSASIATQPLLAQTYSFTVLHAFAGGATDGSGPFGTPVLYNTSLYGTTKSGGANNAGTIYVWSYKTKVVTILHSFAGGPSDGSGPIAGLIQDTSDNFYGTTFGGGANGRGTVFEYSAGGVYTILHSFAGPPSDGSGPTAPLAFDPSYNLYGSTYQGGSAKYGTTFEITTGGVYLPGQDFPPGGALPHGALVNGGGKFYGTTSGGPCPSGSPCTGVYPGTIFVNGTSEEPGPVVYTFNGVSEGAQPMAGLFVDAKGNLFGTCAAGGSASGGLGNGTIFQYTPTTNTLTLLHTFEGPDGSAPMASLFPDTSGNLYGTTMYGGANGYGTVFKLSASTRKLTVVYSFTGGSDGAYPQAGVIVDSKGNIFGVATAGGSNGNGTLFELSPAT